ncbi:MAG: threonine synthase [Endomicrobia bacterium]|nr:threonine synthase [Endomicrobiia bacterium]MDW8055865.1 threonine synthase [Elusimicrobiota bacterium]
MTRIWPGVIEHFKNVLPITEKTPIVTLYEGNTPLIKAENLEYKIKKQYGVNLNIYLKYEGANPTGSFKDRGMTVAISKAKEENAKVVICASTGNTAASAAAYSAKANLRCIVLIPKGAIALGKLSQAVMHGAEVFAVKGNFDEALKLAKQISQQYPVTLVNSLNPYRIEGQKTAAFEIIEQLGFVPDYQFMPVGNAGNITAYWKGYKEFASGKFSLKVENLQLADKKIRLPKMMGFQAAGSAPIVKGKPIKKPKTIATAIRIGNPASWKFAEQARDESGGVIDTVTDKEILEAYYLLSSLEGIFVEPASAASVAGLFKYVKNGYFRKHSAANIVCILTGHGLKDPDCAITTSKKYVKVKTVEPQIKSLIKQLKL